MRVIRDFVAVLKEKDTEKKSSGGLIMVSVGDSERFLTGVVSAVGSGHVSNGSVVPLEVNVGDKVTFSKGGAVEVKDGDQDYWVFREDSIVAVL